MASSPKPILDAQNAVRFMKLHGPEYQGDPKQVILADNSSGDHTAVYASFFLEGEDNLYPDVNAKVSGVIDFYGSVSVMHEGSNPTTINHLQADSPEGMEMGHVDLRENSDLRRGIHFSSCFKGTGCFHQACFSIIYIKKVAFSGGLLHSQNFFFNRVKDTILRGWQFCYKFGCFLDLFTGIFHRI